MPGHSITPSPAFCMRFFFFAFPYPSYDDDEPRDAGLTFSTLDDALTKRIDYAYVRGGVLAPLRCTTIATYPERPWT
jgi:hypothetical protein